MDADRAQHGKRGERDRDLFSLPTEQGQRPCFAVKMVGQDGGAAGDGIIRSSFHQDGTAISVNRQVKLLKERVGLSVKNSIASAAAGIQGSVGIRPALLRRIVDMAAHLVPDLV